MSDASLVSFLQSELLLLSNEIKKKFPEIKESIENIFQLIRKLKDDPDRPNAVDTFAQTETILQPIVLSCRTGNSRIIAIAINCLQKLIVFKAFPRECIGKVFEALDIATEMNSDIQLKALQCLSPLMANYNDLYGAELVKLLSIAFKLQESKVGMVNNASAAIIRQMIISLFEWVDLSKDSELIQEKDGESSSSFEFSHAQDALLILSDITCCLDDQKSNALDLSKVDKPFALDLVESVLVNHGQVIRCHRAFATIIQDRICSYLIDNLKASNEGKGVVDFAKTCRHWRIIQLLITDFNDLFPDEVEIFMAFGIRILRDSQSSWECAMVLEVTKSIFQSQDLIEAIYLICEKKESPRIFKDLLEVMTDVMKRILDDSKPSDIHGQIIDALGKSSVLTQFDKSAPPTVSPAALLLLAFDSFTGWFANISTLIKASCSEKNSLGFLSYKYVKDVNLNPKTLAILTDLVSFSGISVCRVFGRLFNEIFSGSNNHSQIQASTLEFFSRAIVIFSVLKFRSHLRSTMDILVHLSFIERPSEIKRNNLEVIQMILETGHCVAELLEDSLLPLVRVIQAVEQLQSQKVRKQQNHGIAPPVIGGADEEFLAKDVDLSISFIESSVVWEDGSLTFLVLAYSQHIEALLSALADDPMSSSALLLSLDKLKRLTCLNMTRFVEGESCSNSWILVMNELEKVMNLKEATIRQSSMDSFGLIVDLFVKSVPPNRMKGSQSISGNSSADSLQMRVIQPMCNISQSVHWIDINRCLLDCLNGYIHVFGESMKEASWSLVWAILQENLKLVKRSLLDSEGGPLASITSEPPASLSIYQRIHETVKTACGDFIGSIPISSLSPMIELIAQIGAINFPGELNIPLNSVRYLWDISDYLCGSAFDNGSSQEAFGLWKQLLQHLTDLGLDMRPELRNSAVQSLLRTINMNGSKLKDRWRCLFDEILFEFMQKLRQTAQNSKRILESDSSDAPLTIPLGFTHFSRDSESKQWDETECTVMTGVSALILSHFKDGVTFDFPEFPQYWQKFLGILRGYALLRRDDGSVELCSVSINCLYQLSCGLKEKEAEHFVMDLWRNWIEIGLAMVPCTNPCTIMVFFTQESLLKYLKMFTNMHGLCVNCETEDDWLAQSLNVLTAALMCPTPSDQVRDFDGPTEVQKYLINQVLKNDLLAFASSDDDKDMKILIVLEISKWLNLMPSKVQQYHQQQQKLQPNDISMGYASLRSRQSTASSVISVNDANADNSQQNSYSFVAMESILLQIIPEIMSKWQTCPELYCDERKPLVALIKAINRFVRLKYKCPTSSSPSEKLWRIGTSSLISVLKGIFEESPQADLSMLWPTILEELWGALHSCKEMFNRALKIEQIEEDERFDCQLLDLIVESVIPRSFSIPQVVEEAVEIILRVARITIFPSDRESGEMGDFLFPSGVKGLPIAVKEILALTAYRRLFKLAEREETGKLVVLEKICRVLKTHLEAFQVDRQILGKFFAFPRLRDLELHVLLSGLLDLRAREALMPLNDLIVRCADFGGGGGGCEGARIIFKDCRWVLLLNSNSNFVFENEEDEEGEEDDLVSTDPSLLLAVNGDPFTLFGSSPRPPAPQPSISPLIPARSKTPPTLTTTTNSSKLNSSRRSVSEELFDHLSHNLRIMQFNSEIQQNKD